MSGYDDLQRGIARAHEFGMDDAGAHEALWAAVESGDLDDSAAATGFGLLGSCYHATGRQEEAIACLEQAVERCDDIALLANMHHELGESLAVLQRDADAEPHYRRSLELDRQHALAPDTLILLGRAITFRAGEDPEVLDESYRAFAEARALLESPDAQRYTTALSREKTLFDAIFNMACCKALMRRDSERFEAEQLFEQAEQLCVQHREKFTDDEISNLYSWWISMLKEMGRDRDAVLVAERGGRTLS